MTETFKKIAVVGTGTLGFQIALLASNSGYNVTIFDQKPGAFDDMMAKQQADIKAKQIKPFIALDRWQACGQRIKQVSDLDQAVKDADLVIEAVPENLELKCEVFRQLGELTSPGTVLATNSSSIPVSHLEKSSGRPERCLNLHFYMALHGMNMTDVMGGTRTLPEVIEQGVRWVRSLGCIPLRVKKELLGFCFNRVWRAVKREVLYMWANDYVDFRDVDRAWMKFTGNEDRYGPFGLMDSVGLDVIYDIEMVYYRNSQDPKDHPPEALKQKVDRGELGVKTGKGFYTYPNPEYLRDDFLSTSG
ncbi:MAG: 3-hydroxyacyl-CoA dehydrogenase NAD-binding domain-containing protein [Desulfobacterales bacterium]|jgi:3-hydroxybutyryl-CoA dehydrogenase